MILLATFLLLGMTLVIALFQPKEQTTGSLSALLILTCVISWIFVGMRETWISSEEMVAWVSLQMLQGPLLYIYVRSQILPREAWKASVLLHLLPALFMAGLWIIQVQYHALLSLPCPAESQCSDYYEKRFIHRLATWVSIMTYGYYSLQLLPQYIARIKNHYSALQGLRLTWLKCLIWCFILLAMMAVMLDVFRYRGFVYWLSGSFLQAWGPILLMLFIAGFSMGQRNINRQMGTDDLSMFYQPVPSDFLDKKGGDHRTHVKYQSSGLDHGLAEQLWKTLTQLMHDDTLYLKHGLKIADVAAQLSMPVNYVSQAINSHGKQSFYDWVNQYRLNHAVHLLEDDGLKMVDIAEASGFASQSSFYGNFKQRFNMAPRQYRQSHLKNLQ
jgi:AraC-like DNA-binding protein